MGLRERWIICNDSNERALTADQQEKSQQQISTQKKEISTQKISRWVRFGLKKIGPK